MSDILCVTNRLLCRDDFLSRIEQIAGSAPAGIILREKDLTEEAYLALAKQVTEICKRYSVPCILHTFVNAAIRLKAEAIHLPLPVLRKMSRKEKENFAVIGASCHSAEEAAEAEALGCTYITAGHVFATDCKKGVPPRGIAFLESVYQRVSVPVYAIGGIDSANIASVRAAGAKGACIMSGLMRCKEVGEYLKSFEKAGEKNAVSE
ncbi:MAG: thiamine phosphate synthase [Acutalibacteraceae bacterium]